MGEIASYHKKDQLSPSFWALQAVHLLAFLWPSLFVSPGIVPAINLLLDFCFGWLCPVIGSRLLVKKQSRVNFLQFIISSKQQHLTSYLVHSPQCPKLFYLFVRVWTSNQNEQCYYKKKDIITSLELALCLNPVWLLSSFHPVAFIYQPVQNS